MGIHITTDDHFSIFKATAQHYIEKFGLLDWRVHFTHEQLTSRAEIRTSRDDKVASIVLSSLWDEYEVFSDQELIAAVRMSAFHEVCELLLADSFFVAINHKDSHKRKRERMVGAHHGVIRRLENAFGPRD